MDLTLGQAQITLLPGAQAAYEESNDYSIFLELFYGQTSFLFAGDAEETRLAEYLASPDLRRFDVLKVPHHGRACAQSEAFFTSVSPKYAVITCDEEDMPGRQRRGVPPGPGRKGLWNGLRPGRPHLGRPPRSPSPKAPQFSRS